MTIIDILIVSKQTERLFFPRKGYKTTLQNKLLLYIKIKGNILVEYCYYYPYMVEICFFGSLGFYSRSFLSRVLQ